MLWAEVSTHAKPREVCRRGTSAPNGASQDSVMACDESEFGFERKATVNWDAGRVDTNVRPMEVEFVVRDGAGLEFEGHVFPDTPGSPAAHTNLVIVDDCIVETSHPMRAAKVFVHAIRGAQKLAPS